MCVIHPQNQPYTRVLRPLHFACESMHPCTPGARHITCGVFWRGGEFCVAKRKQNFVP